MVYTPCDTSSREQTGNVIMFTQLEDGNIWTKTHNNVESGEKSDYDSIIPPLIIEEEMDVMDYGNESDHDLISTEMLEYICDVSQSHPNINQR